MKRGSIIIDLDFIACWSKELKAINDGKEEGRYLYPESFIKLLAVVHAYVLPYRQLEGFMCGLSQYINGLKAPDYTTIWWRIAKMKVDLAASVDLDKDVTIAEDSSGIKSQTEANGFIRNGRLNEASLRCILLSTLKPKILAIEVTKEDVGD